VACPKPQSSGASKIRCVWVVDMRVLCGTKYMYLAAEFVVWQKK
jgi:hypothetical protein